MKNEKKHTTEEEKLVKDLFEDFSLSSPSTDFKKATMDKVMYEWSNKPIYTSAKISKQNRIWIGVGVAFSLLLIYLFDIRNMANGSSIINSIQLTETQHIFSKTFEAFYHALSQIPLTVYVIVTGLSIVFVFDKLINKLSAKHFNF